MKKNLLLLSLAFAALTARAQQDPLYSQYINNPFVLNPAYAGLTNNLNMTVSYRNQWSSLEGSPRTLNASGHLSVNDNKMGVGLMLVADKIGNRTLSEAMVSYSYRIELEHGKIFSFGLQAGVSNFSIDNSKVNPYDTTDPLFDGKQSELKPTVGFGIILKSDQYFLGLSVPRMLNSKINAQDLQYSLYTQHYYFTAGYLMFLSERIRFKPSTVLKYVRGAPLSVDVNASFIFHEKYQAGILTRNLNTYGLLVQAVVSNALRIGYVFELPAGNSVGTNFLTHEITLGYRINTLPFHNDVGVFSF